MHSDPELGAQGPQIIRNGTVACSSFSRACTITTAAATTIIIIVIITATTTTITTTTTTTSTSTTTTTSRWHMPYIAFFAA